MRKSDTLALLIVATSLVACGKKVEKQSATVTRPATTNLDIAPQTYTRMQFVSDVERPKVSAPAKAHAHAPRAHTASAPDPIASMASQQLAVETTTEAAPVQAPIVMASMSAPHMAAPSADSYIDHSAEGDGLLAGLSPRVVIRGGMVGDHKCDPRSDAQARGELAGRPNSSMPLMPGRSVFGGGRR